MTEATVSRPDLGRARKSVTTLFGWLLFRRLSLPLSLALARTPVRPWQVTLLGALLGVLGGAALATGERPWQLAGAGGGLAAKLLDAVDGELARAKGLDTPGMYVADGLADRLRDLALIVGAGVGLHRAAEPSALAWTLAAAVGYLAFFYVSGAFPSHWREARDPSELDEKHLFRLSPRLRLGAGDTLAVLLAAAAAADRVPWFLWAVGVAAPIALGLKLWSLARRRPWRRWGEEGG